MKPTDTFDDFLRGLNWSTTMRQKLHDMAVRDDIRVLVAWDNAGKLSASAYTSMPDSLPDKTLAFWRKDPPPDTTAPRTRQALALVQGGMTAHAAATKLGLNSSAVYRALARAQNKPLCPCCGQALREGFTVDRSALRARSDAPASA